MTVLTLDLHYLDTPESIASYIVVTSEGPVLVEVGPASTLEHLMRGLADHGFGLSDVKHAFVTHIHLDHAGAAGWLAQQGITVHVHEFGAKHLIDPSKLIASATRIYGEQMDTLWGPIDAAPADRVVPTSDGDVVEIGDARITAIETPGHARHHHAFRLDMPNTPPTCFTGDAAATCMASTPFISLPTPPPEFDLDLWRSSLDRLESESFEVIYPTHFGEMNDPPAQYARVRDALTRHVDFITARADLGRDALLAEYTDWQHAEARDLGVPGNKWRFYVSPAVSRMNVSGVLRWLETRG